MNAVNEQRQTTAIRAALGTTDAEVTRAPGGGWLVRISDERAKLALDLYDRLGDAATADTFVVSTEDGDQMEGWTTGHDWTQEFDLPSQALVDYNRCVVRGTHSERTENGTCVECGTCRSDFGDGYGTNAEGELVLRETAPVDPSGSAADRERYVTERAEFIARAYDAAKRAQADRGGRSDVMAFRDLIDRGVLK